MIFICLSYLFIISVDVDSAVDSTSYSFIAVAVDSGIIAVDVDSGIIAVDSDLFFIHEKYMFPDILFFIYTLEDLKPHLYFSQNNIDDKT
jgi:hypothetical protein